MDDSGNHPEDGKLSPEGNETASPGTCQTSASLPRITLPSTGQLYDRDQPILSVEMPSPGQEAVPLPGDRECEAPCTPTGTSGQQVSPRSSAEESEGTESDRNVEADGSDSGEPPMDIYDRSTAYITPTPMPRAARHQSLPRQAQTGSYNTPPQLEVPQVHPGDPYEFNNNSAYRGTGSSSPYGYGTPSRGGGYIRTSMRNSPQAGPFNEHPDPLRQHPIGVFPYENTSPAYGVNNAQPPNVYRGVQTGRSQSNPYGQDAYNGRAYGSPGVSDGRVYGSPGTSVYPYGSRTHSDSNPAWMPAQHHDTLAWNTPFWEDGHHMSQLRGIEPSAYPSFHGTAASSSGTGFPHGIGNPYNQPHGNSSSYQASSGRPAYGQQGAFSPLLQPQQANASPYFRGADRSGSRSNRSSASPQAASYDQLPYGSGPPRPGPYYSGLDYDVLHQRGNYQGVPTQMRANSATPPRHMTPGREHTLIDPSIRPWAGMPPATRVTYHSDVAHTTANTNTNGNANRAGPSAVGRIAPTGIQGQTIAESEAESSYESDDSNATIRGPDSTRRCNDKDHRKDNGDDAGGGGGACGAGGAGSAAGAGGSGAGAAHDSADNNTSNGNTGSGTQDKGKGKANDAAANNGSGSSSASGGNASGGSQENSTVPAPDSSSSAVQISQRQRNSIFVRVLRNFRKSTSSRSGSGLVSGAVSFSDTADIISAAGFNEHAIQRMMRPGWANKPMSFFRSSKTIVPALAATKREIFEEMSLVEQNIIYHYELNGYLPDPDIDVAEIVDRASEAVTKKKREKILRIANHLYAKYTQAKVEAETSGTVLPGNAAGNGLAAQQYINAYHVREHRHCPSHTNGSAIAGSSADRVERPPTPEVNVFDTAFSRLLGRQATQTAQQPAPQPAAQPVQHPPPSIVLTAAEDTGDDASNPVAPGLRPGVEDVAWSLGINLRLNDDDTYMNDADTTDHAGLAEPEQAEQAERMADTDPMDVNQ
ncbi:hypothetical protein SCUCBS95973_001360 [Sporothrix curviconia]|uniref:Uncharacterized protein n=1 Tax=Sporothrix curviconia TaxID=1260050 RepID=A0ABP0AY28_9PEZI